jgi:hypothetical protein
VWVQSRPGGERAILGAVDSRADEAAIDGKQLYENAISGREIGNNAVGADQLADTIRSRIEGALQQVPGEYITANELRDENFAKQSDIPNTSNLAKQDDLNNLETRVSRLEKRVKR